MSRRRSWRGPAAAPGRAGSPRRDGGQRPALLDRALLLVFAATFAGITSFYLLLSVVPQYAAASGAGEIGAGLATGALFFATTLTELATPRLVAVFGSRLAFAAGLALLGVPALGLGVSGSLAVIAAVCLLRGVGLGLVVVVGSALVAAIVPAERRGEGLGLYGVVAGFPAVFALPLGVWLVAHVGYGPVFVSAALASLAGLAALPRRAMTGSEMEPAAGVLAALRSPALLAPSFAFLTTAVAAGAVITFVPLAAPRELSGLAALALLTFAAASTLTRWWAGRVADRRPSLDLLRPSVLVTAAGTACLFFIDDRAALLASTTLVGAGFGVAQNASLTLMFRSVTRSEFDAVSAVWNLAYDAGLGAGGAGFGVLVTGTGYGAGFALSGALIAVALAAVWRSRHLTARAPAL